MRLDGDRLVIASRLFGALRVFQGGGKIAEFSFDGGDFQVAGSRGVMAKLVGFVIRVERQIEFLSGLIEIALGEGLRKRIAGILGAKRSACKKEKQNREGGSVHGNLQVRGKPS